MRLFCIVSLSGSVLFATPTEQDHARAAQNSGYYRHAKVPQENSMKSVCVRIALKENSIDSVREWFQTLMDRREETLESLRNEGVIVESAFLDRQPNGDFLIYYMRAKDIEAARVIAQNSNLAIDAYHQDCKRKYCGVSTPLEQLLDLCVEEKFPSPDKIDPSFALSTEQEKIMNLVYEEG